MAHHVFHQLSNELQTHCGLSNSKYVTADEQLAIYLHLARTGLSSWMLQERFQCSGDTISKYIFIFFSHCLLLKGECQMHPLDCQNDCWEALLQQICPHDAQQHTSRDCIKFKALSVFQTLLRCIRWFIF